METNNITKGKEYWKDIPDYEGYFQVSSEGRVRSLDRNVVYSNGVTQFYKGKIKKLNKTYQGYLQCTLNKNGLKSS